MRRPLRTRVGAQIGTTSTGATNLEFEILYSTARPEHVAMATIFQGDLATIGVNATLKSAELASYFSQVQAVSYNGMSVGSGVSSQLLPRAGRRHWGRGLRQCWTDEAQEAGLEQPEAYCAECHPSAMSSFHPPPGFNECR